MASYIALLRGINVGGRNMIAMGDLREMLAELGFKDAKTLLQSGNVVFDGGRKSAASVERLLEKETAKRLNVAPDYFVRTAEEWDAIVARNPFPKEAEKDPSRFVAICLRDAPKPKDVDALRASIRGPEVVRAVGRELYVVYPDGQGTSKLTNVVIEKALSTRGTARNWNTVLKLQALVNA
jgi:uncharacterized protein (DUF1697 family)